MNDINNLASCGNPCLRVIVYHYVRDLPHSEFPRINGLLTDDFRNQVDWLARQYEPATLESALAFLSGDYQPSRDLFLLTFDDGLIDHYTQVLPILADRGLQGLFFVSTSCLSGHVLEVHKIHFLMAAVEFSELQRKVLAELSDLTNGRVQEVNWKTAMQVYRWDEPAVAAFKYLVNFGVAPDLRSRVLDALFEQYLGSEEEFSHRLYLSWQRAREMQDAGMLLGGHGHTHRCLATLDAAQQEHEISQSSQILRVQTRPQPVWPFSYPYGTPGESYTRSTTRIVARHSFACAFTTERGVNSPDSADRFQLKRIDTNDLPRLAGRHPRPARILTGLP